MNPALRLLLLSGGSAAPTLAQQVAALFAGGAKGLWYAPSDLSTLSETSNGTLGNVAATDPVGYIGDKSGNANHALQATAGDRGVLDVTSGVTSVVLDGVTEFYSTDVVSAGTWTADMDCFVSIKRGSTADGMVMSSTTGAEFIGCFGAGAIAANFGVGSPTYVANGVAVPGGTSTTREQLATALPVDEWVVLQMLNANLSDWINILLGNWAGGGGFFVNGAIGGVVLIEAQSAANRTLISSYLAQEVGV